MNKANSADLGAAVPLELHELLFKTDRPRAIDRYIDYFGAAERGGEPDMPRAASPGLRDW